jgi:O-antigen/teichoic acid export membrane protein
MQGREGSLGQKLIANTVFNFLGQAYTLVLGLAVVPYVVHHLGAELYGLTALAAALGGFAGLLNLGMGRALSKYVSELYWQGNLERIRELFRTSLGVSLLAGSLACLILIGFRDSLSAALFHGEPSTERYVVFALFVTAFGVLVSMVTESLSALPIALQRFDIFNRVNILLATVRNVGAVAVLVIGWHVRAVLLAYLFASLVGLSAYVYYSRKLLPCLSLRPAFVWADFKRLVTFSFWVLVAGASALVVHRLDRVLVAYFLPIAAVAFYVVPYSLAEKTGIGIGNITSVIFPSASELSARQDAARLKELYVRATKMGALAGLPVTIVLLAVPRQILRLWVGPEFAAQGALTLQLLAGGFFFNILGSVPYVLAQGIGRPWISAKYSLLNGIVNLGLFLVLIPRLGIVGAGAGFFFSQVVLTPLFIWEMNRVVGVSWWRMLSHAYCRAWLCGLGGLVLLWVLRPYVESFLTLTLCCGAAVAVYGALAVVGAVDPHERAGVFRQLTQTLRVGTRAVNP